MSVPEPQRSHGKLEACVKAHDLCVYTIKICSNKKNFPEEFQEPLSNRMVDAAIRIHCYCWAANNILVKTEEDLKRRADLQNKAAIDCNLLLSLIEVAKSVYHLSSRRVIYWSQKAIDTRNLVRAWKESDKNRYKKRFLEG